MLEELRRQQDETKARILKSFGYDDAEAIQKSEEGESLNDLIRKGEVEVDDALEKAVYADTPQNRKLGRVGQEYHRGWKKSAVEPDKEGKSDGLSKKRNSYFQKLGGNLESAKKTLTGKKIKIDVEPFFRINPQGNLAKIVKLNGKPVEIKDVVERAKGNRTYIAIKTSVGMFPVRKLNTSDYDDALKIKFVD
jgi:hypothetical protein